MGDRVSCYLTVMPEHLDRVQQIVASHGHSMHIWDGVIEVTEVNYAEFDDEEASLIEEGIPFTFEWAAGGSFSAGNIHVRFTESGLFRTNYYTEHQDNVPIEQVQEWIQNLDATQMQIALEEYVIAHSKPEFNSDYAEQFKRYKLREIVKP